MKYAFVRANRRDHSVRNLCLALNVSSSGYYDWVDRPASATQSQNQRLVTKILCHHKASRSTYGAPRIQKDLVDAGEKVSRQRVARLMRKADIKSKMARRFVVTTNSRKTTSPAPDRLQRNFRTQSTNQAWVSDTTFIRTRQGWLFLATMIDLYSRKVIGWSMSDRNDTALVCDALRMASARRGSLQGVIVHSDQGSTYASASYQALLKENDMLCSMSRKGECHDNAVAESFFGTLKTELVEHEDYRTRQQAKQSLFEYIEVFYNRQRRHSYLGYISPAEYERVSAH